MRTIAIVDQNQPGNASKIISKLQETCKGSYDNIIVFASASSKKCFPADVEVVDVPGGMSTTPKFRNWMMRYCKDNLKGFIHVIDNTVEVLKDPAPFMKQVENLMAVTDLNCFFGTVTDGCNRVYKKYNPRLRVALDKDEYKNFGIGSNVVFCSHSNIQWITYNIDKADDNELFFDESFTIDMFFIIEFLARRRNSHPGSLYFMNQYITCDEEPDVYRIDESLSREPRFDLQEAMASEDALFKSKNINYAPDNNIDVVLEKLYLKLKSKLPV